jgi:hypothetical protein
MTANNDSSIVTRPNSSAAFFMVSESADSVYPYCCELALVADPLNTGLPSVTVLDFKKGITSDRLECHVRLKLDHQPFREQISDQNWHTCNLPGIRCLAVELLVLAKGQLSRVIQGTKTRW